MFSPPTSQHVHKTEMSGEKMKKHWRERKKEKIEIWPSHFTGKLSIVNFANNYFWCNFSLMRLWNGKHCSR